MKVGVIGCGNISTAYLEIGKRFKNLEFAAVADLNEAKARAQGEKFGVRAVASPAELLADSEVDVVLNLTIPAAHATVAEAAIAAGKHVYNEKPLAVELRAADALLESAAAAGLRVGCAPDTFLGSSAQTVRELLDAGAIGEPVAATAFMVSHGPEHWHPNPEFFYEHGGGPMFDMGPYYLTQLVQLLGPVQRVAAMVRRTFPTRTVTAKDVEPREIPVTTPTHYSGSLEFASGAIGTVIMSFDVYGATLPRIEIYGSEGTLFVPDPNGFGGEVKIQRGRGEPEVVPLTRPHADNSRSVGLSDMVAGIVEGRPHRCSGELARHVLEVMHAFAASSNSRACAEIASTVERPAPLS